MKTALSIAGSDPSGGAGIQADIKTMTMNGVYAMSAITALTAQNTLGVTGIYEVSGDFLSQQLDAVFTDIFPDAVKIGMMSSEELINVTAEKLSFYGAKNVVIDPVMVVTSGSRLLKQSAVLALADKLIPLADVVTPNIPEAEILSGIKILREEDMLFAAKIIGEKCCCSVLVKGGHGLTDANDLLYSNGEYKWFYGKRVKNNNTHGTGCTLSSALASNLAKELPLEESVCLAKKYVTDALSYGLNLGQGRGPMNHAVNL